MGPTAKIKACRFRSLKQLILKFYKEMKNSRDLKYLLQTEKIKVPENRAKYEKEVNTFNMSQWNTEQVETWAFFNLPSKNLKENLKKIKIGGIDGAKLVAADEYYLKSMGIKNKVAVLMARARGDSTSMEDLLM